MRITAEKVKQLIQEAKDSHADLDDIKELEDYLRDIESDKLLNHGASATFTHEKVRNDGTKLVRISTAPIAPEDDEDFEKANFKPMKRD